MLTLISFLGGTAFRLIFGQVMEWMNLRQDHQHEVAMLEVQSKLDAERHERDMARIELQHKLGVQEIVVQADATERKAMGDAFIEAVRATQAKTGIAWVDGWNGCIRPAGATVSLVLWIVTMATAGFVLRDFDQTLIAAFLGVFVGDRIHTRLAK